MFLIIIGSTLFDQLIEEVDKSSFIAALQKKGFTGLHIQYGKGKYIPTHGTKSIENKNKISGDDDNFRVECFDFKSSLNEEIANASLVISHAGICFFSGLVY